MPLITESFYNFSFHLLIKDEEAHTEILQMICLSSFHLYFKGLSRVLFEPDFGPFSVDVKEFLLMTY